jgi:cobalt/nickel transport system permease protein
MHIPDGYLSPATCAVAGAAMVPVIGIACSRAKKVVKDRHAPLLALGAAYSFLVMMFNVPIPGGTTAHAVGAVLIAVLLGPWAAVVCVSAWCQHLQHGLRDAVRRLRRLPTIDPEHIAGI